MLDQFPQALPHGEIFKVVDDVYCVLGTNIIMHGGMQIKASRTMTIIRENNDLTLVNSIRLNHNGLQQLQKLGLVKNVIRLGAFHGRDDAFYQTTYGAKLYAFGQMDFSHGEALDYDLSQGSPIVPSHIIEFKTTKFKEALLLIKKAGGILISCDSIKNWQDKDQFFSDETFDMLKHAGSIGTAKIDPTWLKAMAPAKDELKTISDLDFSILISAHGPALTDQPKRWLKKEIDRVLAEDLAN
jgi:hypothetical protein